MICETPKQYCPEIFLVKKSLKTVNNRGYAVCSCVLLVSKCPYFDKFTLICLYAYDSTMFIVNNYHGILPNSVHCNFFRSADCLRVIIFFSIYLGF